MLLALFFGKVRNKVIWILKEMFRALGIGVTSHSNLVNLKEKALDRSRQDLEFIMALSPAKLEPMITLLSKSKSQLRQDLFVLSETKYKRGGYFVEFGATNGIDLSNTYLLETEFSWKGILAEPANVWKRKLHENRPNAFIETLCVWQDSNSLLTFNETEYSELSTLNVFSDSDFHKNSRRAGKNYEVQTISLNDLLRKYQAPKHIDYLSIDTEGSEYEILNAFNFSEYSIGIITVEHNYTSKREMIFALLTSQGYKRKYENISNFDDWYVKV
jgi:FkbM family methyltransferase